MQLNARQTAAFLKKVVDTGDCWIWTGSTSRDAGYLRVDGRLYQAHRISYSLYVGTIPEGAEVDHRCMVRRCVNPAHLEAVSPRLNKLRSRSPVSRHALATGCPYGHPYDAANTYEYEGRRQCRACRATRNKVRYAAT